MTHAGANPSSIPYHDCRRRRDRARCPAEDPSFCTPSRPDDRRTRLHGGKVRTRERVAFTGVRQNGSHWLDDGRRLLVPRSSRKHNPPDDRYARWRCRGASTGPCAEGSKQRRRSRAPRDRSADRQFKTGTVTACLEGRHPALPALVPTTMMSRRTAELRVRAQCAAT